METDILERAENQLAFEDFVSSGWVAKTARMRCLGIVAAARTQMLLEEQARCADDLHVEILPLQVELARYKKWYYGPRADRLPSSGDLAQVLLDFAEELERKPICPDDVPPRAEPEYELRRVRRRRGRRHLANFENLPVTTPQVYLCRNLLALHATARTSPLLCTQLESWQIEYIPGRFERRQHVRKKYACAKCEGAGEAPQIEVAARAEAAIEKGLAGPGLLAYIVTSKFADYVGFPVML